MAEGAAALRVQLLAHHREAGCTSAPACRDACACLLSQCLLAEAQLSGASRGARESHGQAVAKWCSALEAKLHKAQPPCALAATLMGATVRSCDAGRLLGRCVGEHTWARLLADALRRDVDAVRGAQPAAAGAAGGGTHAGAGAEALGCSSPAGSSMVALCGALGELFSRLHEYLGVKGVRAEASGVASSVAATLVPLLELEGPHTDALRGAALALAATLLRTLPRALKALKTPAPAAQGQPPLEAALVRTLAAGPGCSAALRAAAAECLCLAPRAHGTAAAHSAMLGRVLLCMHEVLDRACMGLEDAATHAAVASSRAALGAVMSDAVAGGAGAGGSGGSGGGGGGAAGWATGPLIPPPLLLHGPGAHGSANSGGGSGGGAGTAAGASVGAASVQRWADMAGALLAGLEVGLVAPFPEPVPLPSAALLALLSRLTALSPASVLSAGRAPPSASGFAALAGALPGLQARAWGLAGLALRSAGTAGLALLAGHARRLTGALARLEALGPGGLAAQPPALRAAVYGAVESACECRGAGAAALLGRGLVGAAVVELYGWAAHGGGGAGGGWEALGAGGAGPGGGGGGRKHSAKRARVAGAAEAVEAAEVAAAAAAAAGGGGACVGLGRAELAAQAGALAALGAVLRAGGPGLPGPVRAQADACVLHVAAAAAEAAHRVARGERRATGGGAGGGGGGGGGGGEGCAAGGVAGGIAALRAGALRALLASVLAPCGGGRPPFLSQAVHLFREGRGSGHAGVAAVCSEACAALEGLLHPRALPIGAALPALSCGLRELAPLPRPRMWSALDPGPALHTPPTPTAAGAAAQAAAATAAGAAAAASADVAGSSGRGGRGGGSEGAEAGQAQGSVAGALGGSGGAARAGQPGGAARGAELGGGGVGAAGALLRPAAVHAPVAGARGLGGPEAVGPGMGSVGSVGLQGRGGAAGGREGGMSAGGRAGTAGPGEGAEAEEGGGAAGPLPRNAAGVHSRVAPATATQQPVGPHTQPQPQPQPQGWAGGGAVAAAGGGGAGAARAGGESSDSEGSLPDIDSGGGEGESEDEGEAGGGAMLQ